MPRSLTVHIIEDDKFVAESIRLLVRTLGFEAECFVSPSAFLENPPQARSSCLIIDLGLSGTEALEFMRKLASLGQLPFTIAITGFKDREIEAKSLALGAITVLQKPFGRQQLHDLLQQAIVSDRHPS